MEDRVSKYPGRVKLTPVDGQPGLYDMVRADQPTQTGTPITKGTLLSDKTCEKLELPNTATPNEALSALFSMPSFMNVRYREIATSGTFITPKGAVGNRFFVMCFGGGGGSGSDGTEDYRPGGGGGNMDAKWLTLTPGESYNVIIGAAGASGTSNTHIGGTGGTTSFGNSLCVAAGGNGGNGSTNNGGDGGTGGGAVRDGRGGNGSYGGGGGSNWGDSGGNGGTYGGGGASGGLGGKYGGDAGQPGTPLFNVFSGAQLFAALFVPLSTDALTPKSISTYDCGGGGLGGHGGKSKSGGGGGLGAKGGDTRGGFSGGGGGGFGGSGGDGDSSSGSWAAGGGGGGYGPANYGCGGGYQQKAKSGVCVIIWFEEGAKFDGIPT